MSWECKLCASLKKVFFFHCLTGLISRRLRKNDVLHLLPFNGLFSGLLSFVHAGMSQGVIIRALVSEYEVRKTEPFTQIV